MEILCSRCHQPLMSDLCYCPSCGLPQLVYSADGPAGPEQQEQWSGNKVQDARAVNWKIAMKGIIPVALLAALLCNEVSPVKHLQFLWVSLAAAWSAIFYIRAQRSAWITRGAGARIGLVMGLIACWLSLCISSGAIFAQRHLFHQSSQMDAVWTNQIDVSSKGTEQLMTQMGLWDSTAVQTQMQMQRNLFLSPYGRAGIWVLSLSFSFLFLLLFATAGGAVGARIMARTHRPSA